jgi:hypothetical protein
MICKAYNAHIRKLIDQQNILWKCFLSDGTEVWSDFNSSEHEKDPWTRLKIYCINNNLNINKVIVLAIGAREETVFEDQNGLDGIFIVRGMSRDLMVDSSIEYKFVSFGLLNKDTNKILVKKAATPVSFSIQFFPEGGDLITDISSRVAFKATDNQGTPFEVKGDIIEAKAEAMSEMIKDIKNSRK